PAWIQISDCPDWQVIAQAFAAAWSGWSDDQALGSIVAEIESSGDDLADRADRAIRLVQDDYRYLSVNLDLGGYVPTPPGVVTRRRFGDCKDLSLLLSEILKRLGIEARPVLVASRLGKTVAEMLPMAGLFDHAV